MINLRNMQEIRQDNDISQEKMASILGVTRDALAKWETCATLPNLKNVFYFAKYFSFSIDYVLGLSRDRTKVEYKEYNPHLLANNLKYLRTHSDYTLMKLSKKLEVSHAAIVRYEQGKSNPSLNVLYRYSKTFQVSFHELCTTTFYR